NSTLTVSFTGTVTLLDDPNGMSGYSVNDKIGGTLTFSPITDSPTTASSTITYWTGNASFDFPLISASGKGELYTENIGDEGLGYFGFVFQTPPVINPADHTSFSSSTFLIDYTVIGSSAVPLQSLKGLPTDEASILAYLGGTLINHDAVLGGGPDPAHQFGLVFNVDSLNISVASTPIPAALPLFVSALGGIGLMGWRRRKQIAA